MIRRLPAALVLGLAMLAAPTRAAMPLPGVGGDVGEPVAAVPGAGERAAPSPIAVARIPAEAEAANAVAGDVEERFRSTRASDALGVRAAGLRGALAAFEGRPALAALDGLSIGRLESLQRQVILYQSQSAELGAEATALAGDLSAAAADLAARRASWEATSAANGELPGPLAAAVTATVARLAAAERTITGPLGTVLAREAEVQALAARVARLDRELDAALAAADGRLLQLDVPPIWRVWFTDVPGETLGMRSLTDDLRFLEEYSKAADARSYAWLGFALALLAVLLWLRRRLRTGALDGDLRAAAGLLERPWSAWFLVYLLGVRLLHPNAPAVAFDAGLLAAVVPLLRLAPGWLMGGARAGLYGVAALFVLDRLRYLAQDGVSFRYALLAVSLCGAVVLGSVAWRAHSRGHLRGTVRVAATWGAATGAVLLAVAGASNAVGNVTLADVLTRGTAFGAYAAALLATGAAVANGIVTLVLATEPAQRLRMVANHRARVASFVRRAVALVAAVAWAFATLQAFRLWQPLADATNAVLRSKLTIGDFSMVTGDLLLFAACVYASCKIAQFVRFLLGEEVLSRGAWPLGVRSTIQTLSFYALVAAGFLVALSATGVELGRFALLAGALGVGVGLGLQNVVKNFVSGVILMFERPIQPGDVVTFEEVQGTVKAIGLRATTIGTAAGAEVVVPNGSLLDGKLVNWAREPIRRIEITVRVAHGSDPANVLRILADVVSRQPRFVPRPAPSALLGDFDTDSLQFVVAFSTDARDDWKGVRSAATIEILAALRAAGVDVAPPRDLRVEGVPVGSPRPGETR